MKPLLYNGDCNEEMDKIPDNSIDLIFTDLPYATKTFGKCVDCKWDTPIDLEKMWLNFMRVKKINTPIFFTCNVKLGYDLIRSAPKKCPFRYDIIWVKSAPTSFLSARRMPMRKHELIYVFYEKLPFYDLSSHTHKFKKTKPRKTDKNVYGVAPHLDGTEGVYTPKLPTSVQPGEPVKRKGTIFGDVSVLEIKERKNGESRYDPPLPTSLIKEEAADTLDEGGMTYSPMEEHLLNKYKLQGMPVEDLKTDIYGMNHKICQEKGYRNKKYTPPLPVSVVGETIHESVNIYSDRSVVRYKDHKGGAAYDPPLPVSVVPYRPPNQREDIYTITDRFRTGKLYKPNKIYDPPLPCSYVDQEEEEITISCPVCDKYPDTILEVKSKKGKHSTQKPVELMKWCLKYYSKIDDNVLDCCMGSGSTGVACVEMNRNFIGIELDKDIFKVAEERVRTDAKCLDDNE